MLGGAGKQKLFCLVEVELRVLGVRGGETRTLVKGELQRDMRGCVSPCLG